MANYELEQDGYRLSVDNLEVRTGASIEELEVGNLITQDPLPVEVQNFPSIQGTSVEEFNNTEPLEVKLPGTELPIPVDIQNQPISISSGKYLGCQYSIRISGY